MPACLVVTVLALPLLLATLASLPALAVLPFLREGGVRAERIISQLTYWTGVLAQPSREVR